MAWYGCIFGEWLMPNPRRMQMATAGQAGGVSLQGTPGELWTWGYNAYGQCADGTTTNRSSPVQVGSDTNWVQVDGGRYGMSAIKEDGTLWGWGNNTQGEIGDGTTTARSSPVQIGSGTDWWRVTCFDGGERFRMAIKLDGSLWAMGRNNKGNLGTNNTTAYSSPVQVGSMAWSAINIHTSRVNGITTDGKLWGWGQFNSNQLGLGSLSADVSVPTQVGSDTDWYSIGGGNNHGSAIKTDGTYWIWGGTTNTASTAGVSSVPVKLGILTNWGQHSSRLDDPQINNEGESIVIVKSDGTLWAWGENSKGELGLGDNTDTSSPVQVGSATTWSMASFGTSHSLALAQNGTIWATGNNALGRLADGTTTNRNVFTQIGSLTTWKYLTCSYTGGAGIKVPS